MNFSNKIKYTLAGVIFGFIFPLLALAIDLFVKELSYSMSNILHLHHINPLHNIIDTAPFFLGLFAYFAGLRQDKIVEINNGLEEEIENKILHLKEMNEDLQAALRYKDNFLSNISHELRTPMNGMLGVLDLMIKDDTLDALHKNQLEMVYDSSYKLLKTMNDIIDFSSLEKDNIKLELETVDIRTFLDRIKNGYFMNFHKIVEHLEVIVDPSLRDYFLVIDKFRMSQVIVNLSLILKRIAPIQSLKLYFNKSDSVGSEKETYVLELSSPGVCLSQNEKMQLLDDLMQLDYINAKSFGVGLPISKKLLELMNGDLNFKSSIPEGNTFIINFKASKGKINDLPIVQTRNSSKRPSILIAEDNVINQKVIAMLLKKLDCDFKIVENGQELLDNYQANLFDMIFMDIQMPVLNGVEATKIFRSTYGNEIPVIGVSANAIQSDIDHYLAIGMSDYISKPVIVDELKKMINKYTQ